MVCALACEALQKRLPGPAWAWTQVRKALGQAVSSVSDNTLRDLAEEGLRAWGRPLRRGTEGERRCLHSLVLEAGIPAALIARREFGDFMRQVQRDLDIAGQSADEVARRHKHRLPVAWQEDDTISLAAEMLTALQPYRQALRHGPAILHERFPGWRDTLPIDMSDGAAAELVQALLQQPKPIARQQLRVLCRRALRLQGGHWVQSLSAEQQGLLDPALTASAPFSDESVVRVRFALGGAEVALAEREDAMTWRFRGVQSRPVALPFDQPAVAAVLVDGNERSRMPLPGGKALGDLPWILVPDEVGALLVMGHGSQAVPGDRIYLAVDLARGSLDIVSGEAVPVGMVADTVRTVVRITGEARWREPGSNLSVRLRTGVAAGASAVLGISGAVPRWTVLAPWATLGSPTVARPAPGQRLIWRSLRTGAAWQPLTGPLPEGVESDIALCEGDDMLDRRRVVVLPADAHAEARRVPGGIEVRVRSMDAKHLDLPGYPDARAAQEGADAIVRLACAGPEPGEVLLRTFHRNGLEVRHRLRVPMPGGGFVRITGEVMAHNSLVVLADLPGLLARAGANDPHAELEVRARAVGGMSLGRVVGFIDDLPLAGLRATVHRLHGVLDDPDGQVRLQVLRSGLAGPAALRVQAFDRTVEVLYGAAAMLAGGPLLDGGGLGALPLVSPADGVKELARAMWPGGEGWSLSDLPASGPWLLVGCGSLAGRVRPRVWPGAASLAVTGRLAAAAAVAHQEARHAAFNDAVTALAAAPDAPEASAEWAFLDATLDAAARHAPAANFDVLRAAGRTPAVLAHWALRAAADRLQGLAALENGLPFLWSLVPMSDWRRAAECWATLFSDWGLDPKVAVEGRVSELATLLPGTGAGMWIIRDALGMAHPSGQCPRQALPAILSHLASHAGPDPGGHAWLVSARGVRDWANLPPVVRDGAPHAAARHVLGLDPLCLLDQRAIRLCRHAEPDDYDGRLLAAVLLHASVVEGAP